MKLTESKLREIIQDEIKSLNEAKKLKGTASLKHALKLSDAEKVIIIDKYADGNMMFSNQLQDEYLDSSGVNDVKDLKGYELNSLLDDAYEMGVMDKIGIDV
jgi:maleate cis-trans isomerase|tara:strand:- start:3535 stop:3840 length:306 start_codon:yes stop_codon:yes gene_type:complete